MIFMIGGAGAGKRAYLREALGFSDAQIADGVLDEHDVLYNLQDYIRNNPALWTEHDRLEALADTLEQKAAVACDEVGCGVIPLDEGERAYREATGRLCCVLAARAERVVRLVCGIPVLLKGER